MSDGRSAGLEADANKGGESNAASADAHHRALASLILTVLEEHRPTIEAGVVLSCACHRWALAGSWADWEEHLAEEIAHKIGAEEVDLRPVFSIADEAVFLVSGDPFETRGSAAVISELGEERLYRLGGLEESRG